MLDLRTDVGARETANSTDSDFLQDSTLLGLYKNITSIKNFFAPDVVFCGGSVKYRSGSLYNYILEAGCSWMLNVQCALTYRASSYTARRKI